MLPYRHSLFTRFVIVMFFIGVLGYGYYELRGILYGPSITLPEETIQSTERFITLTGSADRIAVLRMNGSPIMVTEEGAFEEPYLLSPGLNRIVFDAEDKYGNTSRKVLEIVYTPSEQPQQTATTSSQATTTESIAPLSQ